MKIATVTVHHAHNFGAMLQAYALQNALIKKGYESVIIDYDEIQSSLFPKRMGKSLKFFLSWGYYSLKTIYHLRKMKRGFQRFEDFYKFDLKKTKRFSEISEIDTTGIDMLLVGSDQIWNFKRDGNRPYFQLDFGGDVLRASYAASMGSFFSLSDAEKECFRKSLDKMSSISVREKETADYVEQLSGQKCHIDLDPVFLLEAKEWDELAKKANKYDLPEKYILCYELLKSNGLYECVDRVRKESGLPIVVLTPGIFYHQKGDVIVMDAGPVEMINLIRNAEIVITNSFHGTIYAVLYHKVFYSVLTSHGPGRIIEMLTNMGLEERIYSSEKMIELKAEFKKADLYIEQQNKKSYEYIERLKEYKKG